MNRQSTNTQLQAPSSKLQAPSSKLQAHSSPLSAPPIRCTMKIPRILPALVLSGLCVTRLSASTAPVFDTLAHAPGPRPTAEQVLNNSIPGRPDPASVTPALERNENGYARDRLYQVPPAGQHPRILFSKSDLPRIRAQIEASPMNRQLWTVWQTRANEPETAPATWLAEAYRALAAGDGARFAALWDDPRNPRTAGPPGAGRNPLAQLLLFRSFSVLMADDATRGAEVAGAVATYSAWLRPQVEAALTRPGAENFWLQVRDVVGDAAQLAFFYDLSQPYMTPAQAATVRDLLVLCTQGRYGLGSDLPPHWRNWNFIGMGLYFPLYALAIEGEPGFDPRHVARGAEVARDYILHGNSAHGVGKEGLGYHTAGMAHLSVLGLALANRGDHLFTLARFRAMFDTWMLWTLQPFGGQWASNGDLGTFPPNAALVQTAHWLFPADGRIALVAGQVVKPTTISPATPVEDALLQLLCPAELGADNAAKKAPVFPAGLPLSLKDDERGVLFTRSGWATDDVTLQFNARSDTTFPSHDHADRGDFFLTALGRAWTVPAMRETGSEHHSVITIDDMGQGFFATPARWVSVDESAAGTTATVDLSYCYNWRWMKSSFFATDEQLKAEPWLEWCREPRNRLLARTPRDQWERDPLPQVRAYNEPWLAGDPRMWGAEDAWILRTPYNPVKKAFRSLALVRGAAPFVVIADDIRKDDAEHLYQWRMILPMDVEAHNFKGADIILGPVTAELETKPHGGSAYKDVGLPIAPAGSPQLLVRILEMARPAAVERTPAPAVETVEFVKNDDVHQFTGRSLGVGKRLVLPSRSVEPRYRVLLFPFRAGEALPETKWETPELLAVTAKGVTQRVRFAPAADGSTRLTVLP